MIKSSRRAAVVLSGTALALTAATLPAQAATTGWRVNTEFHSRGNASVFFSVDAVSARDAWTTGIVGSNKNGTFQSVVRHWTGKRWQLITLPAKVAKRWNSSSPIDTQIAASSARSVWVINSFAGGRYLHLSGTRWTIGTLPGGSGYSLQITAVKDLGPDNAWALGVRTPLGISSQTSVPYAAHFNGSRWTSQALPGKGAITAVSAVSTRSIWAVLGAGPTSAASKLPVLHWTAKAGWQQAAVQPALPAGANLTSVLAEPGGTVWIGGSVKNGAKGTTAFAAKWTPAAKTWTLAHLGGASPGKWELVDMAASGRGGIWAVALAKNVKGQPERMWRLTGASWSQVTPAFGRHEWYLAQLATVPGTDSVWGVGALKVGRSADGLVAIAGPTP
jgi:hypothetical protein